MALSGATLTAGNIVAQVALISAVRAALDAITLGVIQRETIMAAETGISGELPTSPYAQRELKLLVTYADDVTGDRGTFTVPMPDLAALTPVEGTDRILLEDTGVMAAFVSAVEDYALSSAGNAITVLTAHVVGRNL
jgi:hypothetical protein